MHCVKRTINFTQPFSIFSYDSQKFVKKFEPEKYQDETSYSDNLSYGSWPARWWTTLQTPGSRSTTGSFSTSIQKLPLSCWRTHLTHCRFPSLHCLASWVTSSDSLTNALENWLMLPWLMRILTQKPLITLKMMLRKALMIWYLAIVIVIDYT